MKDAIELLKNEEALEKTNLTDPDAPIMKGKKGEFDTFFNVQVACNENQIINHCDVVISGNDKSQLIPALEGIVSNTGTKVKIALADADYGTFDSFEFMANNGIRGYVPFRDMNSTFDDNPFHSSHFEYHAKDDTSVCPVNKILKNVGTSIDGAETRSTEYIEQMLVNSVLLRVTAIPNLHQDGL